MVRSGVAWYRTIWSSLPLTTSAAITFEYAAQRFGLLPIKGCLAVGVDADVVLVDLEHSAVLQAGDLFYRHQHSPYVGRMLRGRVVRTLVHGRTVFLEGKVVAESIGWLIRPFPQ